MRVAALRAQNAMGSSFRNRYIFACVAQLVEQRIRNAQVAGSSPAASSTENPLFRKK